MTLVLLIILQTETTKNTDQTQVWQSFADNLIEHAATLAPLTYTPIAEEIWRHCPAR